MKPLLLSPGFKLPRTTFLWNETPEPSAWWLLGETPGRCFSLGRHVGREPRLLSPFGALCYSDFQFLILVCFNFIQFWDLICVLGAVQNTSSWFSCPGGGSRTRALVPILFIFLFQKCFNNSGYSTKFFQFSLLKCQSKGLRMYAYIIRMQAQIFGGVFVCWWVQETNLKYSP